MAILWRPSPNFDARTRPIDLVILHYTGMQSGAAALARLCDPAPRAGAHHHPWETPPDPDAPLGRVSAHYLVQEDGKVLALVQEEARAWHAGAGAWGGQAALNDRSIGVEIVNGGHDYGLPPYPDAQIASVIALLQAILPRHGLGARQVVGHSDVAPERKADPGEHFPWARLAEAGVALWPRGPVAPGGPVLAAPGASGERVRALQAGLAAFGYGVGETGLYDAPTEAALRAFQRRFRPARVDGVHDGETDAILADLLAQA